MCDLQRCFAARLRTSAYYVKQANKPTGTSFSAGDYHLTYFITELERYADKYRPAAATQPRLERRDLHMPFFPQEIFEAYFDPRKKRICRCLEHPCSLTLK
jgi:DNA-directed RNA polymerase III subunit RPC7